MVSHLAWREGYIFSDIKEVVLWDVSGSFELSLRLS